MALADLCRIESQRCGYSAITRMELLGFPGISVSERRLISQKLSCLVYIPLTPLIEDETIRLRSSYRIKLPDAIIAASSLVSGSQVLTHDKALLKIINADLTHMNYK